MTIDQILGLPSKKGVDEIMAVPAYGRSYSNEKEVTIDWRAGKDFKLARGGPYFSIRDKFSLGMRGDVVVIVDPRNGTRLATFDLND